jgi:hypothetical protein
LAKREAYAKVVAIRIELHKSHKISDAQLASATSGETRSKTIGAYAAYCRTNLKLMEAIMAVCCEEAEAAKLKTELSKSLVEQAQDTVQYQAIFVNPY